MRLTTDELPELPLPAAWHREDGSLIAHTPEWRGGGADTAQYRCGPMRLLVETGDHLPEVAQLSQRVLEELDGLTADAPDELLLVRRSLRAALHLVMGRPDTTARPTSAVVESVIATAAEENVEVTSGVVAAPANPIAGGDTVALAVKQLATNARKHDEAHDITLDVDERGGFRLRWQGAGADGVVATSRHPDNRERWGLGMVRLAADALGASVIPVVPSDHGAAEAIFGPSAADGRFTLPLAAVNHDGVVERATRAWDEETGRTPGSSLNADLEHVWRRAQEASGQCVTEGAFAARAGLRRTWVALQPRSTRDYARDLVAGIAHERALVGDGQDATRLIGTSEALALLLGASPDLWLLPALRDALPEACNAFGDPKLYLTGSARSGPSAPLVAFLAEQGNGGRLELNGDSWFFAPRRWNPLLEQLLSVEPMPA